MPATGMSPQINSQSILHPMPPAFLANLLLKPSNKRVELISLPRYPRRKMFAIPSSKTKTTGSHTIGKIPKIIAKNVNKVNSTDKPHNLTGF